MSVLVQKRRNTGTGVNGDDMSSQAGDTDKQIMAEAEDAGISRQLILQAHEDSLELREMLARYGTPEIRVTLHHIYQHYIKDDDIEDNSERSSR